jgi:hypothetical protein
VDLLGFDVVMLLLAFQLRAHLPHVVSLLGGVLAQSCAASFLILCCTPRLLGALLPPGQSMAGFRIRLFVASRGLRCPVFQRTV